MIDLSTKLKQASIWVFLYALNVVTRPDLRIWNTLCPFHNLKQALKITVFTDASTENINNGVGTYSTGAQISWMIDGKSNCCPIAWQANKVKLIVRSTIAAECLSS